MAGLGTMHPGTMHPGSMPPGTMAPGTRPGSMAGMPPPKTGRVPTAQRMGTATRGRQGTAAQPQPVLGVGAMAEVQVSGRPMTTQGVGVKTGTMGPKRQIYDKTYYMLELRRRSQELVDELAILTKELEEIRQGNQLYLNLEKRYGTLVEAVRTLEGDLADHNLASDKRRTDTAPEEVQHMHMVMKYQNDQQRAEVDEIFLEKKNHEEDIQRMEQEIAGIARAAEARLDELLPDQRSEYEDLREENMRLAQNVYEAREELDQVTGMLHAMEERLRSDVNRARYQELCSFRKSLEEPLQVLQKEFETCSLSVPEQRDLLLARVKNDNADIVATEKQNSDLKMEIEKLRAQIREVVIDSQEKKTEGSDQQKYEILLAKEKEMTQFIDSFPECKGEEEQKMKEKQDSIVRLLENITRAMTLASNATPESHLRDIEDELDFKSKQLTNAETTQHRLEVELAKREGELEKIDTLDTKITAELQQVETRMHQYEKEMETKYDLIDSMREEGNQQMRSLQERKALLEERASMMKQQVGYLKLRNESKKQQLADDKVASDLVAQEQKIRQYGQTLWALQSFISQKNSESDVQQEVEVCFDAANQLNALLLKRPGFFA
mmetsp:Transcript_96835/g.224476  ORF Transcript_96835/g.224476 Transcript_96835/m.224476 type:complete len:609 (+) Transcript_96835:128-1954(+)